MFGTHSCQIGGHTRVGSANHKQQASIVGDGGISFDCSQMKVQSYHLEIPAEEAGSYSFQWPSYAPSSIVNGSNYWKVE